MQGKEKYRSEKPKACKYCYWWGGKKKGCELPECKYLVSPKKRQAPQKEYGNCRFCPYGKHQPCIGYCISKLYQEMKERRERKQVEHERSDSN